MNNLTPLTMPPRAPDLIVTGAEETAPAAGQVLADTGAIQANYSTPILATVMFAGDDSVPAWEIAVRDVTNTIDEAVTYVGAAQAPGALPVMMTIAQGQRIVVRVKTAGTTAKIYQASIYGWRLL